MKKVNSIFFLGAFTFFSLTSSAQWMQQGLPVSGSNPIPTPNEGILVALSADGSTAASAFYATDKGGGLFIYRLNGGSWIQQSLISVPSWLPDRYNGGGMAISGNGNTIAITGGFVNFGRDTIRIYVFENNTWNLQSKFIASRTCYGRGSQNTAISSDGNTFLYDRQVWVRNNSSWYLQATLNPLDRPVSAGACSDSANRFSGLTTCALSADGNTAVIGDLYKPDSTTNAWVFGRQGSVWTQQGPRLEGIGNAGYHAGDWQFPAPVAISGDGNTIGISNYGWINTWIFHRTGIVWAEEDTGPLQTVPFMITGYGRHTSALALSYNGDHYVVSDGIDFYYWERSNGLWMQAGGRNTFQYATNFDRAGTNEGWDKIATIGLDSTGTKLFSGCSCYAYQQGGAWYFTYTGQAWQQVGGRLYNASALTGANRQGSLLVLSKDGSTLATGAMQDNGCEGAAWVYKRNGQQWQQFGPKIYIADSIWQGRFFGGSIALSADGGVMAIGAPYSNTLQFFNSSFGWGGIGGAGNVYIFQRNGSGYSQQDSITVGGHQTFGLRVALSDDGNTLLVAVLDSGAYVYVRNGNTWAQQAYLHTGSAYAYYGVISLSGDGNTAVVADQSANGNKGALSMFKRNGTTWTEEAHYIYPAWLLQEDYFPTSVSLTQNGDILFAGCNRDGYTGGLYVSTRSGSTWSSFDSISTHPIYSTLHGLQLFSSATGDTLLEVAGAGNSYSDLYFYVRNGNQWNWLQPIVLDPAINSISSSAIGVAASGDLQLIAKGFPSQTVGYQSYNNTGEFRVFRPLLMVDSLLQIKKATCAQLADGKIFIKMVAGSPPYNYWWSNGGPNTDSAVNLQSGTYYLTITDAAGDTLVRSFDVGVIKTPYTNRYSTAFDCLAGTGAINPVVVGGSPPYSYTWNTIPVQHNDTVLNVTPGLYTYTITDSLGCGYTDSAFLATNSSWVSINSTPGDCSGYGAASVVMYGQPSYLYNWSTGANSPVIDSLTAGIYYVTVSDAMNCSITASVSVPVFCSSYISGKVFFDRNNNCLQDVTEHSTVGFTMIAGNGQQALYGSTDSLGHYQIPISATGNYQVSVAHWQECPYLLCAGTNYPLQINLPVVGMVDSSADFPLLDSGIDLAVETEHDEPFPGSGFHYKIYYGNIKDSVVPSGVVTLIYDSLLVFNSSNPPYSSFNPVTRTITWNVTSIGFLQGYGQFVQANFTVPVSTLPHTWGIMESSIAPTTGDCNPANNHLLLPFMVSGSLDPNYKAAFPENEIYTGDSIITYTIHFQNTGFDSTHFIEILDTLSPYLDPASVRTVSVFHHPYSFRIKDGGVLDWIFNPYALPDSATDAINSQGYVSFEVRLKPDLLLGAVISNTADIYFDYNTPVITNTVVNIVTEPTLVPNIYQDKVRVYPNPFSQHTIFEIKSLNQSFDIDILDPLGRNVFHAGGLKVPVYQFQRDKLSAGCYLYKVTSLGTIIGCGKLLVD